MINEQLRGKVVTRITKHGRTIEVTLPPPEGFAEEEEMIREAEGYLRRSGRQYGYIGREAPCERGITGRMHVTGPLIPGESLVLRGRRGAYIYTLAIVPETPDGTSRYYGGGRAVEA